MKDRSRDSNFFRRWLNISIREIPVLRVGLFLYCPPPQENKAEQTLGFLSYQDFSVAFELFVFYYQDKNWRFLDSPVPWTGLN